MLPYTVAPVCDWRGRDRMQHNHWIAQVYLMTTSRWQRPRRGQMRLGGPVYFVRTFCDKGVGFCCVVTRKKIQTDRVSPRTGTVWNLWRSSNRIMKHTPQIHRNCIRHPLGHRSPSATLLFGRLVLLSVGPFLLSTCSKC